MPRPGPASSSSRAPSRTPRTQNRRSTSRDRGSSRSGNHAGNSGDQSQARRQINRQTNQRSSSTLRGTPAAEDQDNSQNEDEDEEEEEEEEHPRKRKRDHFEEDLEAWSKNKKNRHNKSTIPFRDAARWLPRSDSPFLNINNVFTVGAAEEIRREHEGDPSTIDPDVLTTLEEIPERESDQCCKIFKRIMASVPRLRTRLAEYEEIPEVKSRIIDLWRESYIASSGDDNKSLKHDALLYIDPEQLRVNPPVAKTDGKAARGFNHLQIAALLCPQKLRVDFDADSKEFQNKVLNGRIKITASEYPSFLYDLDTHVPGDVESGLMRGYFLVRVYLHIFISPSKAQKHRLDDGPAVGKTKATRAGNGRLHGLTAVTPGTIAYAATKAWFTLSTMEAWSDEHGSFNLREFHETIVEVLEDAEDEWAKTTMEWWNHQIFGITPERAEEPAEETGEAPPMTDREKSKAAKAARKAAALELTRSTAGPVPS